MRKVIAVLMALAFIVTISCASIPEEHKGAATGAGVGAAGGAVAGAALGGTRGAVLGGLAGGLLGGAVGHYGYDQRRNKQETASAYNYDPAKGTVVRIENATASPQTVNPGGTVNLGTTYAVLSPQGQQNVTETREIRFGNDVVGKPQVTVQRADGTYTSNVPLTLPATAQKGTYTVTTTVQAGNSSDTRQMTFNVS
jgi:hypothetical protein